MSLRVAGEGTAKGVLGGRRQTSIAEDSNAIAALRSLESKIKERGMVDPEATYKVAEAYAPMGENTSALRTMRQSIENGFFPYPYFAIDPLLKTLRRESEFTQLLNAANERHERFKKRFF